jgi:hypothetical protein
MIWKIKDLEIWKLKHFWRILGKKNVFYAIDFGTTSMSISITKINFKL